MLKTLEKRIAASNALRHGVHFNGLLAWENPAEFDTHVAATIESLNPCHHTLKQIAEEIAWLSWLLKRNHRAGEIFELSDPFGALLAEHRGQPDEAVKAAKTLIKQRDQELQTVAKAARISQVRV